MTLTALRVQTCRFPELRDCLSQLALFEQRFSQRQVCSWKIWSSCNHDLQLLALLGRAVAWARLVGRRKIETGFHHVRSERHCLLKLRDCLFTIGQNERGAEICMRIREIRPEAERFVERFYCSSVIIDLRKH